MTTRQLPSKLAKEPLIDVIFEIRFSSSFPGSAVLPGLLLSKLKEVSNFEAMPIAQLPQQMREMDPNLQFSPLSRLTWGRFAILVGDRSVGVGCVMPYPGWADFKGAIEQVMNVVLSDALIKSIERYSIKYVDFFETNEDAASALSQFNIDLRVGMHAVKAENSVIRVEIPRAPFLHAVQMMTHANLQLASGAMRSGAILDVDTLTSASIPEVQSFITDLPRLLDEIHLANKQMFFECLSESGLSNLEPQYE
ncbi:MAG: TIGR04255 family protein [Comamonadaceae bacterium]|nr:TIGR04255 family protein [Comamonadaceae bacterium]